MTANWGPLWLDDAASTKAMKRLWRKRRHVFSPPMSLRQWAYRMAVEDDGAHGAERAAARWLERKS
jgi:hypothetical protein